MQLPRFLPVASVLLASLVLSSCLTRPEVRSVGAQGLSPQAQVGSIAVLPFDGPYGHILASRVSYELLQRGYGVIPQDRVRGLLADQGVTAAELYGEGDTARAVELGRRLEADVVVVGSVAAIDEAENQLVRIADEFRPAAPLKVRNARAEFLRVADGEPVAAATFAGKREYGVFTPNYRDAARALVEAVTPD